MLLDSEILHTYFTNGDMKLILATNYFLYENYLLLISDFIFIRFRMFIKTGYMGCDNSHGW